MGWTPIIGKAYSPGTDMLKYVRAQKKLMSWAPKFVVLHNTAAPTIAQWHSISGEQRMANLAEYYSNQKWSSGPHFFAADDGTWAFTPLSKRGTHSPSWNYMAIGVEMVGDYDHEAFQSGLGLKVQQHAVDTIAAVHLVFGFDSSTIKLHKEDPSTTHDCPGANVHKDDFIKAVHDRIVAMKAAKL